MSDYAIQQFLKNLINEIRRDLEGMHGVDLHKPVQDYFNRAHG